MRIRNYAEEISKQSNAENFGNLVPVLVPM